MRILRNILFCLVILAAQSCREAAVIFGDNAVAKVGRVVLTPEEVAAALPKGVAAADSVALAEAYVEKWVAVGVFVSLIIAAVLLIAVAVLCILKREKLAEALKAYKSEMKKITWYSWKNVVRGTVFVVVSVLVIGVVVGLLDIVFFELQYLATGSGFSFFGG